MSGIEKIVTEAQLQVSDIQIGAVEVKNATTDDRIKVNPDGSIDTSVISANPVDIKEGIPIVLVDIPDIPVISDNYVAVLTVTLSERRPKVLTIQILNVHTTNSLTFKIEKTVFNSEIGLNIVTEQTLSAGQTAVVNIVNELVGIIKISVKRGVAGSDSTIKGIVVGE